MVESANECSLVQGLAVLSSDHGSMSSTGVLGILGRVFMSVSKSKGSFNDLFIGMGLSRVIVGVVRSLNDPREQFSMSSSNIDMMRGSIGLFEQGSMSKGSIGVMSGSRGLVL